MDKPIIFDQVRDSLTIEYLNTRYKLDSETPSISPKMVVIHHTVIPTFEKSFKAFNNPLLPNSRPEIAGAGNLNVSSHFMVDRDGTIYRLMPETKMARHVIGLNHCSIGIENVGGTKETPLTKKQLNSNIKLVKYLASKYPIEYVIGHYQYTLFENTPLWLEVDDNYRTPKNDPDEQFLKGILNKTTHFNFKPVPVQKESNTN
ncbi:peptidoglycan recognition family protein [Spongiivirga sp. MCCC 1A20706]|uniref:peptidoglycan recognition protein family protein n=1 Tax=Spongiivirga sp. MCCC 1A20706 TaxID=3160963 RepID=UPI003977A5A5